MWRRALGISLLCVVGCRARANPAPSPDAAAAAPAPKCVDEQRELAPGIDLERTGCLTLVRVDPARWPLRVLTGLKEGGRHRVDDWVTTYRLAGAINASMFAADDRSIGMLISGAVVNNGGDNPKLGAFLAFDPVGDDPPVVLAGRDCPGFDLAALKKKYRSVVQNYRILDCDGKAIAWKDPKTFSAAAVGLDADGKVVFIHSRVPHQMSELARLLAAPALRLRAAMYVEGGPEASLFVRTGTTTVREVGSFETRFFDDSNTVFWPIPNVIGFGPKEDPR
jgi:hypothetical protein